MAQIITKERAELLRATELTGDELDRLPELTAEQNNALIHIAETIHGCKRIVALQLMQIAECMKQARAQVDDGNWRVWLMEQGFAYRTAMQYIQAAERFGGMTDKLDGVTISNMFKMLSVFPGTEQDFIASHDIAKLSARATAEAVKAWNEERAPKQQGIDTDALIADVRKECDDKLRKANEDLKKANEDLELTKGQYRDAFKRYQDEKNRADNLEEDLQTERSAVEQLQEQLDQHNDFAVDDILQAARSDPNPMIEGRLPSDTFAWDVAAFISQRATLPNQHGKFAAMPADQKTTFREYIKRMRDYLDKLEAAVNVENVVEAFA